MVVGGSAGSIDALREVLGHVPLTATVAIALHIPASPNVLSAVLGGYTDLAVREAVDKMPLRAGCVVVAPPDYHLLVEDRHRVALSRDPAEHFSRPAIDPLFESAAVAFGAHGVGVLLSGANADGARGLAAMQAAGGRIAIQDPATAFASQMPLAGLAVCTPEIVAGPADIGRWLARLPWESR